MRPAEHYRSLAEWKDLNASSVVREWVNGETFLYLGRAYRLSLVTNQTCHLKLKEGHFCLDRMLIDAGGSEAAKQAFERCGTRTLPYVSSKSFRCLLE